MERPYKGINQPDVSNDRANIRATVRVTPLPVINHITMVIGIPFHSVAIYVLINQIPCINRPGPRRYPSRSSTSGKDWINDDTSSSVIYQALSSVSCITLIPNTRTTDFPSSYTTSGASFNYSPSRYTHLFSPLVDRDVRIKTAIDECKY